MPSRHDATFAVIHAEPVPVILLQNRWRKPHDSCKTSQIRCELWLGCFCRALGFQIQFADGLSHFRSYPTARSIVGLEFQKLKNPTSADSLFCQNAIGKRPRTLLLHWGLSEMHSHNFGPQWDVY